MPLLQPVLAPTQITTDAVAITTPYVTPYMVTLANGSYALAFADISIPFVGVVWAVFDAQGQPVSGLHLAGDGGTPVIAALSGGGFALAWPDPSFGDIFTAVDTSVSQVAVGKGFDQPDIAGLANGGYVITSTTLGGGPDTLDIAISIRGAAGNAVLPLTNISNSPEFDASPSLAVLADGNFAVVWSSGGSFGDDLAVAVYTPDGDEVTAPFEPSPTDGAAVVNPYSVALANGGFAAVWGGPGPNLVTAVYDASGHEVVAPFVVADPVLGDWSIAALANGNYVVAWGGANTSMAIFTADGQPVSGVVNVSGTIPTSAFVQITPLSNGAIAFTWEGIMPDSTTDIFTAVHDAQGNQLIAPVNVSNQAGLFEYFPAATALADGAYAITWGGGAGDQFHAVYQFFDVPLTEIQPATNISNDGNSIEPTIATLPNGNYAVTYATGADLGSDLVWKVFDPQGAPIDIGVVDSSIFDLAPAIAPVTGGFALAWEDAFAGGIYTAVFEEDGDPVLAPTLASGDRATDLRPIVTSLSNGGYAVTWHRLENSDIYTVAYDAAGVVQGAGPINVTDSPGTADQFSGTDLTPVTALSGGGYALAWTSGSGNDQEIFAAIYSNNGQELVAPLNVSNNPGEADGAVEIAALSTGGYALTWQRAAAGGGSETVTAVRDALGGEVSAPAVVAASGGTATRIAALAGGNYALFWSDGADVFTAVYDDHGQQVSAPVNVSNGLGADTTWDITVLSNGAYALTWTSGSDLFTAVYTAQGQEAVGPVNVTNSPGVGETFVQATALADGAYALSWEGASPGNGFDVFTAVYQFVPPPPLNEIQPPTNINPTEFSFGPPQIVTLANGNFAVTYSSVADVFFEVFDPLGQFVTGGEATGNDLGGPGTAIATVSGGFALAWETIFDPIHTAVYTEQGQVVAAALPVSTDDPSLDIFPMITSLSGGGYAVVWQRETSADSEIYTAIYDAQGQPVAAPINVTESPTVFEFLDPISGHSAANVVGLSTGGYALAWTGQASDNEIYTAVYSDLGVEIAAPVNISQNAGDDSGVRIAALSTGGYALVWVHGLSEIHTAVYDDAGNEVAPPTLVGSGAGDPRIAALAGGDYALFWSDGADVFTAVYDNLGQEVSAPVNVSGGLGQDSSADITVLSNGAYALTWTSDFAGVGDDDLDLFTAVYTAQGEEAVGPINVTQSPGVNDFFPATTALADGAYAITWNSGDRPYTAVYQFVAPPPPADVTYDGVADISLDLSALINLGGSLTISNNGNLATIDLSNLISIGGNFTLSNNGALLTVTMPNLPTVGGSVSVSGDTGVVDIDFGNVTGAINISSTTPTGIVTIDAGSAGEIDVGQNSGTVSTTSGDVAGNITITDNTGTVSTTSGNAAGEITITDNSGTVSTTSGNVTGEITITDNSGTVSTTSGNATGNITITENTGPVSTTSENVTGNITITENTGPISTTSENVTGNITITDNTGPVSTTSSGNATGVISITGNTTITIDFGALISAGAIVIADNGVITLDLTALVSVGGDVSILNNSSLLTIDMPNLATVDGSVSIATPHTTIDLGSLDAVAGDVTIAAGPDAISVDASALGPGGGTVVMEGGSNDDTTIHIGALANMAAR